jgi:transposase, IS5 family
VHEGFGQVTVDTTVQPKTITFPTDAKLLYAAIRGAQSAGQKARRAAAAIPSAHRQARRHDGGRYAYAKQF